MFGLEPWTILGIIAILCLLISFFIGKNAIWGGLTLGIIVGLMVGIISWIIGSGFNWTLLRKILIVAVLAGALFEIVGRLSKQSRKLK